MYTGTKQIKSKFKYKYPEKIQVLTTEEEMKNGVIVQQLKWKTKSTEADPNITIWDFNVLNLMRIGALPTETSTIKPSIEKLERDATTASFIMDRIEFLNEMAAIEQKENTQENENTNGEN